MKIPINLTNKWLYSFIFTFFLLILGIGVWAFQSGQAPNVFGHSGEEVQITINGQAKLLSQALQDLDTLAKSMERKNLTFEVYAADQSTWACVDQDLKELCGDNDGCLIRLLLQHETQANDEVRVIDEIIFMEQNGMSANRNVDG